MGFLVSSGIYVDSSDNQPSSRARIHPAHMAKSEVSLLPLVPYPQDLPPLDMSGQRIMPLRRVQWPMSEPQNYPMLTTVDVTGFVPMHGGISCVQPRPLLPREGSPSPIFSGQPTDYVNLAGIYTQAAGPLRPMPRVPLAAGNADQAALSTDFLTGFIYGPWHAPSAPPARVVPRITRHEVFSLPPLAFLDLGQAMAWVSASAVPVRAPTLTKADPGAVPWTQLTPYPQTFPIHSQSPVPAPLPRLIPGNLTVQPTLPAPDAAQYVAWSQQQDIVRALPARTEHRESIAPAWRSIAGGINNPGGVIVVQGPYTVYAGQVSCVGGAIMGDITGE